MSGSGKGKRKLFYFWPNQTIFEQLCHFRFLVRHESGLGDCLLCMKKVIKFQDDTLMPKYVFTCIQSLNIILNL